MNETQHTIMLLRTTVMLTRKQIAEELHVTYNTVGRWERGEFDMHPVFIKYLIMRYKLGDESASSANDTTQLGELVSEPVAEPQPADTAALIKEIALEWDEEDEEEPVVPVANVIYAGDEEDDDTTQLRELVSEPIPIRRNSERSLADVRSGIEKMFANFPD